MKSVDVVTGGGGFIGLNLVDILASRKTSPVRIYDNGSEGFNFWGVQEMKHKHHGILEVVFGDVTDTKELEKVFNSFEIVNVYHLAAQSVAEEQIVTVHDGRMWGFPTFSELWDTFLTNNSVELLDGGQSEVINIKDSQYKAIGQKCGMGWLMPINQISRHKFSGKIARMRQKWGEIRVTPNHSVYSSDGTLCLPGDNKEFLPIRKISWFPSNTSNKFEIKVENSRFEKNKIYLPNDTSVRFTSMFEGNDLKSFLRVLGGYVSGGWTSYNTASGSYHLGFSNNDLGWLEKIRAEMSRICNAESSITQNKDGYQLEYHSKLLHEIFKKYGGQGPQNKMFPSELYQMSPEFVSCFLDEFWFSDGSAGDAGSREYHTTSYKLSCQLSLLCTLQKKDYTLDKSDNTSYTIREVMHYQSSKGECDLIWEDYDGWVYDISVGDTVNFAVGVGNIVVHNSHVDRSIHNPSDFFKTNIMGTVNILEYCRKYKDRTQLLVVSTDEVYGDEGPFPTPWGAKLKPSSPYSSSKAAADLIVESYRRTYGLPIKLSRCCNNFGEYQNKEKFLPTILASIKQGRPIPVYGDGKQMRQWVPAREHARRLIKLMEGPDLNTLVGGVSLTNMELIGLVREIVKDKYEVQTISVADRPGHDLKYELLDSESISHPNFFNSLTQYVRKELEL